MAGEESGELPPGWGEVVGIWLDVERGKPVRNMIMFPGVKTDLFTKTLVAGEAFFIIVGESLQEVDVTRQELYLMLKRGNVNIGLYFASLTEARNVRLLYNWHLKALKEGGFLERFTVVDADEEQFLESEIGCILSKELENEFEKILEYLRKKFPKTLKSFREMQNCSLELVMLGPTYLII